MLLSSAVVGSETLVVMSTTRHFFCLYFAHWLVPYVTGVQVSRAISGYAHDVCSVRGSPEFASVTVCMY